MPISTCQGGTITIRGWSDKDYLYISVTDTGIGISKQDQEKLFTQFFVRNGAKCVLKSGGDWVCM